MTAHPITYRDSECTSPKRPFEGNCMQEKSFVWNMISGKAI
jgi:hypothetical protein